MLSSDIASLKTHHLSLPPSLPPSHPHRNYQTKFIEMRSHLQGAALKLETVRSHEAMATAMRSVTSAMVSMNKQVNVPALTKIMTDFARENEKSELMGDMLGDAMDDAMTEEGDEEEQERIVGAVLTELGLIMTDAVPEAPGAVPASAAATATANPQRELQALGGGGGGGGGEGGGGGGGGGAVDPAMSDLEARLNNLRREG